MAEALTIKHARIDRLSPLYPDILQRFLVRAVMERGLTDEDIEWNARLGRAPHWKETAHPEEETKRRAEWTRRHPPVEVV